jgi:hypothetical protein
LRKNAQAARRCCSSRRKEILDDSLCTYREVVADGAFGVLWVDSQTLDHWAHVFASIQSLHSVETFSPTSTTWSSPTSSTTPRQRSTGAARHLAQRAARPRTVKR